MPGTAQLRPAVQPTDDHRRRACRRLDRPALDPRSIGAASRHRAWCPHGSDPGHRFRRPLRSCDSRRIPRPHRGNQLDIRRIPWIRIARGPTRVRERPPRPLSHEQSWAPRASRAQSFQGRRCVRRSIRDRGSMDHLPVDRPVPFRHDTSCSSTSVRRRVRRFRVTSMNRASLPTTAYRATPGSSALRLKRTQWRRPTGSRRRFSGSRSGPRSIHGRSARSPAAIPGHDHGANNLPLPREILQQLKQSEEIPFRTRNVARVSGIGGSFERRRPVPCERASTSSTTNTIVDIARSLRWEERRRRALARSDGTRDPVPAHQHKMEDMRSTSAAGRKITWTPYQRVSVSAPIVAPPRSTPATISPASGVNFEMLMVTTVAQYAR